jgi:hypothetical protein
MLKQRARAISQVAAAVNPATATAALRAPNISVVTPERTPSPPDTGRIRDPAALRAAAASRAFPFMMKNIEPPAPAPAALPPSAPAASAACSNRAISGVRMPASSACWCFQFSLSNAATRARSARRKASTIASPAALMPCKALVMTRSPRSKPCITREIVSPETRLLFV